MISPYSTPTIPTIPTWHSCKYERTPGDWVLSIATMGAWDFHRSHEYTKCLWHSASQNSEKTATTATTPTEAEVGNKKSGR